MTKRKQCAIDMDPGGRKRMVNPFLIRVRTMLDDTTNSNLISWSQDGCRILLKNCKDDAAWKVELRKHFKSELQVLIAEQESAAHILTVLLVCMSNRTLSTGN